MSHIEPDLVAMRALGAELPHDARQHLAGCTDCDTELRSLTEVVELGRSLRDDPDLITPPAHVWAAIAAATGGSASAGGSAGDGSSSVRSVKPSVPADSDAPRSPGWRIAWTLAAAVVGVLAGAGAVLGWQAVTGDSPAGDPALIAEAVLDPLPDRVSTGVARVVDDPDERRLVVDLAPADAVDGYLMVWLLTPDVSGMVSLGVLSGDTVELPIPDGLDLGTYSVVDVSVEPFDGDPTHSGDSLVRGALDSV